MKKLQREEVSKLVSKEESYKNRHGSLFHKFLLTYSPTNLLTSKAFTMAEILLSLTIIGVVAAITLPSLTGNVNERVWNTQRKALYARFSQALALMPNLSGYGNYDGVISDGSISSTTDTAAEAFLTEGLSKVIKINNICDATHLTDCGIPTSYVNMAGSTDTFPTKLSELNSMFTGQWVDDSAGFDEVYHNPQNYIDTKAAAFETQNGESIVVFYNPACTDNLGNVWQYSQPQMCANFIYDLNGNKGPNTVGKDIGFITALYPTSPTVVAPMPHNTNLSSDFAQTEAGDACLAVDSESRLPNRDELSAMFYNGALINMTSGSFWSSSTISSGEEGKAWVQSFLLGDQAPETREFTNSIRCIKR